MTKNHRYRIVCRLADGEQVALDTIDAATGLRRFDDVRKTGFHGCRPVVFVELFCDDKPIASSIVRGDGRMNAPTEKQLNYIASLLGVKDNAFYSSAYAEIARVCGFKSQSQASRKASKQDASRTIDALKASK